MDIAAEAECPPPYRHSHSPQSLPNRTVAEELDELALAPKLRKLLDVSRRLLVRRKVARQPDDLDDLLQEVLCSMAPNLRTRPIEELLDLVIRVVSWRALDYIREQRKQSRVLALPADVAAEAREEAAAFPERPDNVMFLVTLTPRKARLCSAIFAGCKGIDELARVAMVPAEAVVPLLTRICSRAEVFFPGQ